jgi:hypothetical protein
MPDTPEKRRREAQKRRNRELKAERKRLRKEGLLGQDNSGLFAPGERPREAVAEAGSMQPPPEKEPERAEGESDPSPGSA